MLFNFFVLFLLLLILRWPSRCLVLTVLRESPNGTVYLSVLRTFFAIIVPFQ